MLMACCQSKWSFTWSSFQIVMIASCRFLGADLGNGQTMGTIERGIES